MCQNTLLSAAEEYGLKTRFCFEPVSAAPRLAKSLLPYGKVLLLADESVSAVLHSMRGQFAGFKIFCVVLGGGDRAEGLFSLPDDVRLCVAVGRRSIAAARFFCTLRGAFLLAVPDMLYQEGMLSSASSGGYPVEEPDIVLFDENTGEIYYDRTWKTVSAPDAYRLTLTLLPEESGCAKACIRIFTEGQADPIYELEVKKFVKGTLP